MKLHHKDCGGAKGYAIGCRCPDVQFTPADARALWAVRVLDAFKRQRRHGPYSYPHRVIEFEADNGTVYVDVTAPGFHQTFEDVKSFDAARHAAALVVFPTLPADVRAKLGECP